MSNPTVYQTPVERWITIVAAVLVIVAECTAAVAFMGWTPAYIRNHVVEAMIFFVAFMAVNYAAFSLWQSGKGTQPPDEIARNRSAFVVLIVLAVAACAYFWTLPSSKPDSQPDVTVRVCGSTTIGESFMTRYLTLFCLRNHAAKVQTTEEGGTTAVTAEFPGDPRAPDEVFRKKLKVCFLVKAEGTAQGLGDVLNDRNKCQLCMASTDISATKYASKGPDLTSVLIGLDAIAVVVPSSSPIKQVTPQDLAAVFLQPGLSRRQIGGTPVVPFCRRNSGTTTEFVKYIQCQTMQPGQTKPSEPEIAGESVANNIDMLDRVASTPNSMGYLSYRFASLRSDVRVIPIVEPGNGRVKEIPSDVNIVLHTCALTRKLYFYAPVTPRNESDAIALAIASNMPFAQGVARMCGVLNVDEVAAIHSNAPAADVRVPLIDITNSYRAKYRHLQANLEVRYELNGVQPTASDVDRIATFAKERLGDGVTWVCVGGADSHGSEATNLGYGDLRAADVMEILANAGLKVVHASVGAGCPRGRDDENRRVEVMPLGVLCPGTR